MFFPRKHSSKTIEQLQKMVMTVLAMRITLRIILIHRLMQQRKSSSIKIYQGERQCCIGRITRCITHQLGIDIKMQCKRHYETMMAK